MKKSFIAVLAAVFAVCFLGCKTNVEVHSHEYSKAWSSNAEYHWHDSTCGHEDEISGKEKHTFGEWTVTKEATEETEGEKERKCSVCAYIEKEAIAKLIRRSEITYDETDGHKIVTEYVDEIKVKETLYDNNDLIVTINEYDKNENVIKTIKYDHTLRHIYEYDSNNQFVKVIRYDTEGIAELEYQAAEGNFLGFLMHRGGRITCIYEYNSNELVVKEYYTHNGFYFIYEYDSNGYKVKDIGYNSDGLVKYYYTHEYDSITGNEIKETYYNADGSVHYCRTWEYDSITGKKVKFTYYNPDDTVYLVYQAAAGNYITSVHINSDGSVNFIEEYDSITDNRVKYTKYNLDGTVNYIFELNSNGNRINYIKYNSDGTVLLQYQADEGNYINIYYDNGSLSSIEEYDSNKHKVRTTYYNSDGTVKEVITY